MKPTNPPYFQDYGEVIQELIDVLSKYEITLSGWENIKEAIDTQVKLYTYISIKKDDPKKEYEIPIVIFNKDNKPIYKVDKISDSHGRIGYLHTIWRDMDGNEMEPFGQD